MVTDGCTTITWNYQSSPARNKHPLHPRNRQNDNTLSTLQLDSCLLSKVSTVFFSVLHLVSQTLRTGQRIKQIAILSITSLPTNYRGLFCRTKIWPRWRLVISIVSASSWLWILTTSLCCFYCLENNIHEKSKQNSHRLNSLVSDPREDEVWASWLPIMGLISKIIPR